MGNCTKIYGLKPALNKAVNLTQIATQFCAIRCAHFRTKLLHNLDSLQRRYAKEGKKLKFIYLAFILLGLSVVSACTSVNSDDSGFKPEQIAEVASPGDTVNVLTKSDGKYQFVVAGITNEEITGGGVTVKNKEIKKLTVTTPDGVRKTFKALSVTSSILNIIHVIDAVK